MYYSNSLYDQRSDECPIERLVIGGPPIIIRLLSPPESTGIALVALGAFFFYAHASMSFHAHRVNNLANRFQYNR
jgi:hypothetical protein